MRNNTSERNVNQREKNKVVPLKKRRRKRPTSDDVIAVVINLNVEKASKNIHRQTHVVSMLKKLIEATEEKGPGRTVKRLRYITGV